MYQIVYNVFVRLKQWSWVYLFQSRTMAVCQKSNIQSKKKILWYVPLLTTFSLLFIRALAGKFLVWTYKNFVLSKYFPWTAIHLVRFLISEISEDRSSFIIAFISRKNNKVTRCQIWWKRRIVQFVLLEKKEVHHKMF